jgi:hypothetical protein
MVITRSIAAVISAFLVAPVNGFSGEIVTIDVAQTAPHSSSPPISRDFQSFSIEFAFLVDFNGKCIHQAIPGEITAQDYLSGNKSHPNKFTNNLLANLREFNGGVPQILRIGGNTQYACRVLSWWQVLTICRDHVTYCPEQEEAIINYWDPAYNADQPRNTSIGPSFWESFTAIEETKYIFGLNFYKNDSYYLENLKGEVQQSLLQIPADRLHLFEVGNENDYGALSGFRPPNWTQQDWVNEWINRTEHIQTAGNTLRFYAPSTCCYNITTEYSFFSGWTIWNDTFRYDRDGWIDEVSQHG